MTGPVTPAPGSPAPGSPAPGGRDFRCSRASEEAGDGLAGSASTVRAFLLVEAEGAWGAQALRASLLTEPVQRWLGGLERRHGVRPLLVRRSGRARARGPVSVFAAWTAPGASWTEHTALAAHDELPALEEDVAGIGRGARPGWTPYDSSLFLVCTQGRHDACCAERGRPVWEAMRHAAPERSWQVSHIGGDRFAANVVVLPQGLYYGRMQPHDAARLVAADGRGVLLLDHLRGRSSLPFAVQAAEVFLRRALALTVESDLSPRTQRVDGDLTTAVFVSRDVRWEVLVRTHHDEPRQLTCGALAPSRPLRHELVGLGPAT
ncbi:MAG TPA: sucrase ferredoxin [Marmoricola sp.]|nr:sucrase ferredoxin [Marmoricola sp.]